MLWRVALLWGLLTARGMAGEGVETFYIGTYTGHSKSEGIYAGTLDTITGQFGALKLAVVEKNNPNFLALSPDHRFLFAALSKGVESFRIESDAMLKPINTQPFPAGDLCHVSIDHAGRALFVASYGGGAIGAFPVDDGMIGECAATMRFTGSGPNPVRQKKPYAHSAYADPLDAFVYACDLGTDSIWSFKLGRGATLTATNPPAAKVPPGSGPRHLAFSADGRFVYVVNEVGVSTSVFSRDVSTGTLTLVDTESNAWPGDPVAGTTSAEIVLHPSGKWLYVSNRKAGHDTISVFEIEARGRVKLVQCVASPVKCPRSIAVDPGGHWMVAAGQNDNSIGELRIDPETGQLSLAGARAMVGSPVCVLFVPDLSR